MANIRVNKEKETSKTKEKELVDLKSKSEKKVNTDFNSKIKLGLKILDKYIIDFSPHNITKIRNLLALQKDGYIIADINDNEIDLSRQALEHTILFSVNRYNDLELRRLHCIRAIRMTETVEELNFILMMEIFNWKKEVNGKNFNKVLEAQL